MLDITPDPRERFPIGSRVLQLPPTVEKGRGSTIWIDGDCFSEANDLIAQFKAGKLTESDAQNAICELAYGCAAKKCCPWGAASPR